jgi:hypothetical protein
MLAGRQPLVAEEIVAGRNEDVADLHGSAAGGGVRRGIMRIAFTGAGQTSWQMRQPVQISGTITGRFSSNAIAPGTGHWSEHIVQAVP